MQEEAGLKMHPSAFLSDLEAADKTFNGKFWKVKCGFFFQALLLWDVDPFFSVL